MLKTVKNGALIRSQQGGGILTQYNIYFSKGVAGNKAPPSNELGLIIDAAGGTLLKSLTAKAVRDINPLDIIIVTSNPATTTQKKDINVNKLSRLGAKNVTTSWLFNCFMLQRVNFSEDTEENNEDDVTQNSKRRRGHKSSSVTKTKTSPSPTKARRRRRGK